MFTLSKNKFVQYYAELGGPEGTERVLIGEMGELITALMDAHRSNKNERNVIEEIVDVIVCINTFCYSHGITSDSLIDDFQSRLVPRFLKAIE